MVMAVEQIMKAHVKALKDLGIDLEAEAKAAKKVTKKK